MTDKTSDRSVWRRGRGAAVVFGALVVAVLGTARPAVSGCCEEGKKEAFIEFISNWPSPTSDLPGCTETTQYLAEEFADAGGWKRTRFKNTSAWETDWKSTTLPGGADDVFADTHDFAYMCGHGNTGSVSFTTNNDDKSLVATDARFGDHDLEWVTFDTSKTLRDSGSNVVNWASNALMGLNLLIGWHDSPLDGDTGGEFADEMIDLDGPDGGGQRIRSAWFDSDGGCTDQSDGTTQAIIAEENAHFNDHLHGEGSIAPENVDNDFFLWKHDC